MATKKAPAKRTSTKKAAEPVIHSIKGFDSNLACRGYQFEIGKTYEQLGAVEVCRNGFHACTIEAHPLSVFDYYPPAGARYCLVEQRGSMNSDDDIKIASSKITIGVELSISDLDEARH